MAINAIQVNDDTLGDLEATLADAAAALAPNMPLVTTTVNGDMSAGDKVKLDGIVGQTDSLDANPDRFLKMETNGTQGPFGLGSTLAEAVGDIDDQNMRTGFYRTTATTLGTFPAGTMTGTLQNVKQAAAFGFQLFSNTDTSFHYRRLTSGVWGAWIDLTLTGGGGGGGSDNTAAALDIVGASLQLGVTDGAGTQTDNLALADLANALAPLFAAAFTAMTVAQKTAVAKAMFSPDGSGWIDANGLYGEDDGNRGAAGYTSIADIP